MKYTPKEMMIQKRLKPGMITLDGFLGNDDRHYQEIITEDLERLKSIGKTYQQIASRMQYLTDKAFEYADEETLLEDIYLIKFQTERGKIVSPFMDKGLLPKGVVSLTNLDKSLKVRWTPLNIHMIRNYGFFEGKGAKHRLEPDNLVKAIF